MSLNISHLKNLMYQKPYISNLEIHYSWEFCLCYADYGFSKSKPHSLKFTA